FLIVCPVYNNLGGCLSVYGPMQFILYRSKKAFGSLSTYIVINSSGIDVRYFLIELPFAQANFPYPLELLFKVLFTEDRAVILQPFIIHGKTFDCKLLYDLCSPFTERNGTL